MNSLCLETNLSCQASEDLPEDIKTNTRLIIPVIKTGYQVIKSTTFLAKLFDEMYSSNLFPTESPNGPHSLLESLE